MSHFNLKTTCIIIIKIISLLVLPKKCCKHLQIIANSTGKVVKEEVAVKGEAVAVTLKKPRKQRKMNKNRQPKGKYKKDSRPNYRYR